MKDAPGPILVTGASRGIGRATVLRLARDGRRTIAHYGKSDQEAATLAHEAAIHGPAPHLVKGDLSETNSISNLAAQIISLSPGGLGALIHNAGIALRKPFTDVSSEELDRLYAVNARAPFLLTQKLASHLQDGATIILVSTVATRHHFSGLSGYAMSKAALEAFALQIAPEFGARGIRVNVVAPGAISTDMTPALSVAAEAAAVLERQVIKRTGRPDDVADAIAMLLSNEARWITGAVIPVSGGTKL